MTEPQDARPDAARGQLDREAAIWCVRMHGEEAAHHEPAFEAWLRRGALHREAYNRMAEVYLLGARLPRTDADRPITAVDPDDRPGGGDAVGQRVRPDRRRLLVVGTAAAAALGIGAYAILPTNRAGPDARTIAIKSAAAADVVTHAAPRAIRLPDGTRVSVGPRTRLLLRYKPHARAVVLSTGSARFAVAGDPRPFTVLAGGGRVVAGATRFDVAWTRDALVIVRLIAGTASVTPPATPPVVGLAPPTPITLTAGQRYAFPARRASGQAGVEGGTFPPDGSRGPLAPARPGSSPTQPETVGDLIDRANALGGSDRRVVAADPIRAIRLSGRFAIHDPAIVADRLALLLGLEQDRSRPGLIELARPRP